MNKIVYDDLKLKLENEHYEKGTIDDVYDFYFDICECEFDYIFAVGICDKNIKYIRIGDDEQILYFEDVCGNVLFETTGEIKVIYYFIGNAEKDIFSNTETYYIIKTIEEEIVLKCFYKN